jgi:hypothetical protein
MSLQELDRETTGQHSWLARFKERHPNFFTEKVVAHREGGNPSISPLPEPKQYWQTVTRKLGGGKMTHVLLHVRKNKQEFYFKCPHKASNVEMPVDRDMLMDAIALVRGSEWVRIPIGTEILRLNRAELRAAVQKLESL